MFRPNLIGRISNAVGYDVHARPLYSDERDCPFAPVNLAVGSQKTSVRADSSASRGTADEIAVMRGKILVPAYVEIEIGDRFAFAGAVYRIEMKHVRMSVTGQIDHFECDVELLPESDDDE